jgi:hypothetical protein
MRAKWRSSIFAFTIAVASVCAPACASVSIAGGGFLRDSPSQAGGGVIVSSGDTIPAVPLEIQGSLLVPITSSGGYAFTAELRGFTGGGYGGAYVGAGAGIGDLSSDRSVGAILTIFGGKAITQRASIEVRLYKSTSHLGATAGFLGVRFSL